MGMPISSYTVLSALSNPKIEDYDRDSAISALEPFNLFAFIIHDPEIHCEFDSTLTKMFDRLDYETGQKLLFFALVKPSEQWLAHAKQRDYERGHGI